VALDGDAGHARAAPKPGVEAIDVKAWWAVAILCAGCGSGAASAGQAHGAATSDAGQIDAVAGDSTLDATAADVAPCLVRPHLKSLEQKYFGNSCAFSSCHTTAKHAGGLDLSERHSFQQLVGVAAMDPGAAKAGLLRVVPGKPEASFLFEKVHGPVQFGVLMPLGTTEVIDPECSVKALKAWIEAGALDD
jgi:hypothetical protein